MWTPGAKGVVHIECPDPSAKLKPIRVEKQFDLGKTDPIEGFPQLFEHQREVVHAVKDGHNKLYLGWEMGTGKTLGSLVAAYHDDAFPLIIVCPAIAKINWQREVKKWLDKEAEVISGRKPYTPYSDVIVINYDILDAWVDELRRFKAKGIIFDEAQYIKNPDSQRSKAAKAIAEKVNGLKFMLSGTPTPNSVYDLVMPLDILGVLKLFGGKRMYISRYCPAINTNYGVSHSVSRNLPELHQNLKNSCFIRRTKEECLDLPEKIRVDIPLSVEVQDDMEFFAPLLAQMRKGTLTEARRVVKESLTYAQAKAHVATARKEAGEAKVDAIVELAKSIEEPLVIMVHHKTVQAELKRRIKNSVLLSGGMTEKARQQAIDDFQDGKVDVIICSITAAGTGINLQRGTQMIMGEMPISYALQDQAESRCHRNGAKNALTVSRMIALGTYDEQLVKIISRKQAVSAAVEDGEATERVTPEEIVAHRLVELYSLSI